MKIRNRNYRRYKQDKIAKFLAFSCFSILRYKYLKDHQSILFIHPTKNYPIYKFTIKEYLGSISRIYKHIVGSVIG